MSEPATVRLEIGGNIIGHLNLHRTPKMLRFTVVGRDYKTLDALDQLDDEPRDNETLVAAVLVSRDMVHIDGRDKDGKRFGRWLESVTYRMIESQPPQEVMRDTTRWQEWASETLSAIERAAT